MPRQALSPWWPRGADQLVLRLLPRTTTARIGLLLFVVLLAGSALLLILLERATQSQLEREAQGRITEIANAAETGWRARGRQRALELLDGELAVPGPLVIRLENAGGQRVTGNLPRWPTGIAANDGFFRGPLLAGRGDDTPYMATARAMPDGHRLLVGRSLAAEVQLQRTLTTTLIIALPLALLLAVATSRLITRIIAGRAHGLASAVSEVTAGKLHARVDVQPGPPADAFDSMGQAFNVMLARVEALLDELRAVTDGLAHDLRSPLSRLKARIDRLSLGTVVDAADLAAIGAEADALLAMLDNSLEISRAEAGIGRDSFAEMDLAAMVHELADMYEPLAEDAGVRLAVGGDAAVPARAHRQLLGRALANLIDNALRYGAAGQRIELTAEATGDGARLSVADHGPGIPAGSRREALRRFGRLDAARGLQGQRLQGAGLGLSLAAAVARLHGGTITLSDNRPGLKVAIDLPAVPAAE
jgi:signal transduction histidine kinase